MLPEAEALPHAVPCLRDEMSASSIKDLDVVQVMLAHLYLLISHLPHSIIGTCV